MLHFQGSHFSNASSTRTEPDPRALVGAPDVTAATEPPETVTTVKMVEDSAGGSGNNTVAIIIGLAVALIALAGICCALVYKIKMEKLRLMYDQQVNDTR